MKTEIRKHKVYTWLSFMLTEGYHITETGNYYEVRTNIPTMVLAFIDMKMTRVWNIGSHATDEEILYITQLAKKWEKYIEKPVQLTLPPLPFEED